MKKSCRFRANYFIFGWTITLNFGIFSHKADLNIEHKSRGPFHTLFWLRYPSNSHFACKKESHTGLDQLKGEKIRNTGWMISLNRSALFAWRWPGHLITRKRVWVRAPSTEATSFGCYICLTSLVCTPYKLNTLFNFLCLLMYSIQQFPHVLPVEWDVSFPRNSVPFLSALHHNHTLSPLISLVSDTTSLSL